MLVFLFRVLMLGLTAEICLGPEIANADGFEPLEVANYDLSPRREDESLPGAASELAPADMVQDEEREPEIAKKRKHAKKDFESEQPEHPAVKRVIRGKNFEKLILANGDVIVNIKGQGKDAERAFQRVMGGAPKNDVGEVPLQPTEDWARLPSSKR